MFDNIGQIAIEIIITAIITACITSVVSGFKVFSVQKDALKFLIQDRIVQAHDYFTKKGSIGKHSLSTIENLYKIYKLLKGNGFIEELMNDLHELDIT